MGQENSKIQYSGEGPDFGKYLPGLKEAASKTEWVGGIVINFGTLDPLITIAVETTDDETASTGASNKIPQKYYSHILYAKSVDENGVSKTATVYLRQVTKEEATEYMSIRKPPIPPPQPNFKYPQPSPAKKNKQSDAPTEINVEEVIDISNAIDDAVAAVEETVQ